jgi:hypothetical protein
MKSSRRPARRLMEMLRRKLLRDQEQLYKPKAYRDKGPTVEAAQNANKEVEQRNQNATETVTT